MEREIYGKTGTVGVDGMLNAEQAERLNYLQADATEVAFAAVENREPDGLFPLIGMATGIGKGNIIHRLILKQLRRKEDSKILLIAGTKISLVRQTHSALAGYQSQEDSYITAEDDDELVPDTEEPGSNPLAGQSSFMYKTGKYGAAGVNVEVGTVQEVASRMSRGLLDPDEYDLAIVDEVHNIGTPTRKEKIGRFKNVVGLTATTHRHSGKHKTPNDYGFEQVYSYTLPEAQEDRLLPPLVGIQIDTKEILDHIPTNTDGTINYKMLEKLLKQHPDLLPYIADRLAPIIAHPEGHKYKTVVAVNFVWEAQELAKLLAAKGIKTGVAVNQVAAKQIHNEEIPALDALERYKLPEDHPDAVQVVISPYVAAEGFDAPFTEVMAWASPTDSDLRYTQFTGRLPRRAPGKKLGIVIDCVYQTDQYNWSYNMGMWMKGDVQQLDNGMLYLGPQSDIESISQLPSVQSFATRSDRKSLAELQEEILQLAKGDIVLSQNGLGTIFIGGRSMLMRVSETVLEEVMGSNPEFVDKRRLGNGKVYTVVTAAGRAAFIEKMVARGIQEKPLGEDLKDVQPSDLLLTQKGLPTVFLAGDHLLPLGREVYETLTEEYPEYFAIRLHGTRRIMVVTEAGRTTFIAAMQEKGAKLKDETLEKVKATDFTLTQRGDVEQTFQGGIGGGKSALVKAMEEVESEHPEWFALRKRATGTGSAIKVVVAAHVDDFKAAILEKGIKPVPKDSQPVGDTELPLIGKSMRAIFKGGNQRVEATMREVAAELKAEHPEWFVERVSGKHIIDVVTEAGRTAFIAAMQKRGVQTR